MKRGKMMYKGKAEYLRWLSNSLTPEIQTELTLMKENPDVIQDSFYQNLHFGTGGLRGVLGAGINRMNLYTIAKATQGYGAYLHQYYAQPTIAIAYDSRIMSEQFAETTASVLASQGILVLIYPRIMPTPALSFAVRNLNCNGGIVITASHNPKEYNGYKIYGKDGCQITTGEAQAILTEMDSFDPLNSIPSQSFQYYLEKGLISYIKEKTCVDYLQAVSETSLLPASCDKNISIVYTPLHGAGISCVPSCLKKNGFTNILIPKEQGTPDGNFPTCSSPNPEESQALSFAIDYAKKNGSQLVLATDPDCDRVGVAVLFNEKYVLMNGNEIGLLLLFFIASLRKEKGNMPQNPLAIKTIVTSPLSERIAQAFGIEMVNVLTGFKYIGEYIGDLEQKLEHSRFIFGFEESCGYLSSTYVRDKDGVNASLLICEMFAYYQEKNQNLVDVLNEIYKKFGATTEKLCSYVLKGSEGSKTIQTIMKNLRENPPKVIENHPVTCWVDYLTLLSTTTEGQQSVSMESANVYMMKLGESGKIGQITVRPSGTEPKIKIYLVCFAETKEKSKILCDTLAIYCNHWITSQKEGV